MSNKHHAKPDKQLETNGLTYQKGNSFNLSIFKLAIDSGKNVYDAVYQLGQPPVDKPKLMGDVFTKQHIYSKKRWDMAKTGFNTNTTVETVNKVAALADMLNVKKSIIIETAIDALIMYCKGDLVDGFAKNFSPTTPENTTNVKKV